MTPTYKIIKPVIKTTLVNKIVPFSILENSRYITYSITPNTPIIEKCFLLINKSIKI